MYWEYIETNEFQRTGEGEGVQISFSVPLYLPSNLPPSNPMCTYAYTLYPNILNTGRLRFKIFQSNKNPYD